MLVYKIIFFLDILLSIKTFITDVIVQRPCSTSPQSNMLQDNQII